MAQTTLTGPDSDHEGPNTREETPERGSSFKKIIGFINEMFTEVYAAVAAAAGKTAPLTVTEDSVALDRALLVKSYAFEDVPDPAELPDGLLIRVSDGNAGAACLAVTEAGAWLVVELGSAISDS